MLIRTANAAAQEADAQVEIVLPKLYPKQRAAFFLLQRIGLCHASTKAGKTVAAITWQLCQCWGDGAGKAHLWVSPIYAQAENVFERVCRILTRADPGRKTWDCNKSKLYISFSNGSRWFFKGADNPDSIYGADYFSAVVDEASRCKEQAWHAIVSTTTKTGGPIRAIGNMVGRKDWFYHLCNKARAGEPGMGYSLITWKDAVEAGVLSQETVDEQRNLLPQMVFRALYECIPSEDGSNPFGHQQIAACIRPMGVLPPVVFGIDLAKSHDWAVIVGLDACRQVCHFERWQGPWEITEQRILAAVGDKPALIDSSGVGDPIVERLARKAPQIQGYKTGVHDSKTALIHGLIMSVQQGKVYFPDDSPECPIRSEMESYEYSLTATGKISYSAPQGSHDDCVIGLGLADMQFDRIGASEVFAELVGGQAKDNYGNDDHMWKSVDDGWR